MRSAPSSSLVALLGGVSPDGRFAKRALEAPLEPLVDAIFVEGVFASELPQRFSAFIPVEADTAGGIFLFEAAGAVPQRRKAADGLLSLLLEPAHPGLHETDDDWKEADEGEHDDARKPVDEVGEREKAQSAVVEYGVIVGASTAKQPNVAEDEPDKLQRFDDADHVPTRRTRVRVSSLRSNGYQVELRKNEKKGEEKEETGKKKKKKKRTQGIQIIVFYKSAECERQRRRERRSISTSDTTSVKTSDTTSVKVSVRCQAMYWIRSFAALRPN